MNDYLIALFNDEFFKSVISAILGAIIALIGVILTLSYQNKRWIFTNAIDIRTKSLISTYHNFLDAFFKINLAGNVGEDKVSFNENINVPISNYLISINEIDIWISADSSKKLRDILGIFRALSHEIFIAKGGKPIIDSKDWIKFSDSLELMKNIIREEIRSEDLRKFIFSIKIK